MKHPWTLREQFELIDRIAINRMTFEAHFTKTKERIEFSFNGWDGKSYNGETRHAYVYRTDIPGYEDARFIKVGKGVHYVEEAENVLEKATALPTRVLAGWWTSFLSEPKQKRGLYHILIQSSLAYKHQFCALIFVYYMPLN